MGPKSTKKDRADLTAPEWRTEWGGAKQAARVPFKQLRADTLDTVKSLVAPLAGKRLVVCGGQAAATGALRAGSTP